MVTEEPSVVAACSLGAKIARVEGGFRTAAGPTLVTGMVQLVSPPSTPLTPESVSDTLDTSYADMDRGGGLVRVRGTLLPPDTEWCPEGMEGMEGIDTDAPEDVGGDTDIDTDATVPESVDVPMYILVSLDIDVCDAMGANIAAGVAEACAPLLEGMFSGTQAVARIVSNLAPPSAAEAGPFTPGIGKGATGNASLVHLAGPRLAVAECLLTPASLIECKRCSDMPSAIALLDRVERVYSLGVRHPARAVTHNKGIMNGVSAVALATGQDTRAIEACNHTLSCKDGQALTPMPSVSGPDVYGLRVRCRVAVPIGVVGGLTTRHARAACALSMLVDGEDGTYFDGASRSSILGRVMAAVGLAQNMSAVLALAGKGISQGHMRLHASRLAAEMGCPDPRLAAQLSSECVAREGGRISEALVRKMVEGMRKTEETE
ncbi:hydroxymethylglutaryl-CoA reductase, class I/II [Kipferlia bialata]|uniref:Hydroxymethylglutaryl-CoA reductase, class I/II n=1 Tax=Kipferlia bialata TaxID=797122 RepID=A0A9K3CPF2_9EUKA|nr:hydroxymethylglutaryl-CoA reductase, class I/II [Kipferlia bialata]|eukprot:g571.t1